MEPKGERCVPVDKQGRGTWNASSKSVELLQKHNLEFNILCVLSQANAAVPGSCTGSTAAWESATSNSSAAEFDQQGNPLPFHYLPGTVRRFLCELFELWWPDRARCASAYSTTSPKLCRAEAGNCTMHETCDSYVVVEYTAMSTRATSSLKAPGNSQHGGRLVARDRTPPAVFGFAFQKTLATRVPGVPIPVHLPRRLPKLRHGPHGRFEDLDYFCQAYQAIYARSVNLSGRTAQATDRGTSRARPPLKAPLAS